MDDENVPTNIINKTKLDNCIKKKSIREDPEVHHWIAVKRIFKYLKDTIISVKLYTKDGYGLCRYNYADNVRDKDTHP